MFTKLEESKDLISDFVVLHSLKIYTSPSTTGNNKEYDFLLFSAERKLIVAIEVKQNKAQINKAKQQLDETKMFEERFGDQVCDK